MLPSCNMHAPQGGQALPGGGHLAQGDVRQPLQALLGMASGTELLSEHLSMSRASCPDGPLSCAVPCREGKRFQAVVISLKETFFSHADALVGVGQGYLAAVQRL